MIQNNELTKTLHMKYNGIIYSRQVLEKSKHIKIRAFQHLNRLEIYLKKSPILMHFAVPITIQL